MIQKLFCAFAALTCVCAVPAKAAYLIGGASGTARVLITGGYYDLDGLHGEYGYPNILPTINVAGELGTLKFSARIFADVPRDYSPYGNFTPFYSNSFRLTLDDVTLSRREFQFSDSNYEPDPGETYHFTSSDGNAKTGFLSTYYGENGGPTFYYYLSYLSNGQSGSGVIQEGNEDDGLTNYVSINYTILSGGVSATVPEPASWAMLIIGFGAVGGSFRGKRARRLRVME